MKSDRPIRINTARMGNPAGGRSGEIDPLTAGRVQIIRHDRSQQAAAVIADLQRLKKVCGADWACMAVLGRTHQELAQIRALAEREGIPIRWWADRDQIPPLHRIREIHNYLEWLRVRARTTMKASEADAQGARASPALFLHTAGPLIATTSISSAGEQTWSLGVFGPRAWTYRMNLWFGLICMRCGSDRFAYLSAILSNRSLTLMTSHKHPVIS